MERVLTCLNLVSRIRRRLRALSPQLRLEYDYSDRQYWLIPVDGAPHIGPMSLLHLPALLEHIGVRRLSGRDDTFALSIKGVRQTPIKLPQACRFKFITLVEAATLERLRDRRDGRTSWVPEGAHILTEAGPGPDQDDTWVPPEVEALEADL